MEGMHLLEIAPSLTQNSQEFNNSRPLSQRISIAQNAINTILPQLNSAIGEFNGKHPSAIYRRPSMGLIFRHWLLAIW